jgi:TonB family protein
VDPEFSDRARKKKVGGACLVSLVVDTSGNPQSVHIVKSIADGVPAKLRGVALELDQNAIKAVKQYRFSPGTFQGKAVPVELSIDVDFRFY